MLNGREKVGNLGFNWNEYAFGIGKRTRRRIGFGKYDDKSDEYSHEIYIRELSIVEGGLGSGLWDAAIILARWIYTNHEMFKGKRILELGSGVGLPGILTAFYADYVVLTDYIESVLDNLKYNVGVNSNLVEEYTIGGNDAPDDTNQPDWRSKQISERISVEKLDWTDRSTWTVPKDGRDFDIILGSELTYSDIFVKELGQVLDYFMSGHTLFIEILSEDRDGVLLFLERIEKEHDIEYEVVDVDESYLGSYNTGQRSEKYKLYYFKRKNDGKGER